MRGYHPITGESAEVSILRAEIQELRAERDKYMRALEWYASGSAGYDYDPGVARDALPVQPHPGQGEGGA